MIDSIHSMCLPYLPLVNDNSTATVKGSQLAHFCIAASASESVQGEQHPVARAAGAAGPAPSWHSHQPGMQQYMVV